MPAMAVVAPLMAQGQMLGLIYVGNDNVVNLFESSSLDVMSIFAGQASLILQNAILLDELTTDKARMEEALGGGRFGDVIGSCASLREVYKRVDKVARTDINVLITGETGTGKELVARELHQRSSRANGPFVVVNCGAIPENLMESEFFGHVRGAFTGAVQTRIGKFQAAHGGTLFLDEIGEIPTEMQVKLLRVLQEGEIERLGGKSQKIDIRLIAATNKDLKRAVLEGRFREDLFYRLHVVPLAMPPLRERAEDIPLLAEVFLTRAAARHGLTGAHLARDAMHVLGQHDWPGNVRELANVIEGSALLSADGVLRASGGRVLNVVARGEQLPPGGQAVGVGRLAQSVLELDHVVVVVAQPLGPAQADAVVRLDPIPGALERLGVDEGSLDLRHRTHHQVCGAPGQRNVGQALAARLTGQPRAHERACAQQGSEGLRPAEHRRALGVLAEPLDRLLQHESKGAVVAAIERAEGRIAGEGEADAGPVTGRRLGRVVRAVVVVPPVGQRGHRRVRPRRVEHATDRHRQVACAQRRDDMKPSRTGAHRLTSVPTGWPRPCPCNR